MPGHIVQTVTTMAPLLLMLIGLSVAVLTDPYITRRQRMIMLLIAVLTTVVIFQNAIGYLLTVRFVDPFLRTAASIIGYSVRPVIIILFLYIVGSGFRPWLLWLLAAVNFLIHLTALFTPDICFGFPGNVFHRGPLGYSSHIVSGILLAILLIRTIREYRDVGFRNMLIPIGNAFLIASAVVLDSVIFTHLNIPITFLTMSMVCATVFYYIWLHLQFVRKHEQDLMAAQRIGIMMTQIQPHFLYNTITTFKALCKKDPAAAAEVADKFGLYLRQNLDSLGQTGLIPFSKELEHTKLYADIEIIRFENVRVEYDIEDDGFSVPPLTLQPMVENAIRHGVRIREDGRVLVRTRKLNDMHEITVRDNGAGFDTSSLNEEDSGHIGINNVRERIESMCGGSFGIESVLGEGTIVTMLIPDKEAVE